MGRRNLAVMALLAGVMLPVQSAVGQNAEFGALERTPGLQLIAAVDAMHAGDLTKANALFTLVIDRNEMAPEGLAHALYNRALVRQRMGWDAQAVADFDKAISSNMLSIASRVNAYYNRGLALRKLGRLQAALDDFTRAIELNPRFAPAYYSRALGLAAKGHYILALADFDKALRYKHPQPHRAWYGKALTHLARGEYRPARKALRMALKIKPDFRPAKERLEIVSRLVNASVMRLPARRSMALNDMEGGMAYSAAGAQETVQLARDARADTQARTMQRVAQAETATAARERRDNGKRQSSRVPKPNRRPDTIIVHRPAPPAAARHRLPPERHDDAAALAQTGMAVPGMLAARSHGNRLFTASIAPTAAPRKTTGSGTWSIQIGSQPSAELAKRLWGEMRSRIRGIIARPRPHIVRSKVRGRIMFRLRLTGYDSRREAASQCALLRQNSISCFVVKAR